MSSPHWHYPGGRAVPAIDKLNWGRNLKLYRDKEVMQREFLQAVLPKPLNRPQ